MNDILSNLFGLGLCIISSTFFGSMYVACRKFDLKDGFLVQWLVSFGIFIIGLILNLIYSQTFNFIAMFGGFLWATGNVTAIPIINTIGLGMGILIWGITNCLSGWIVSKFGFFSIPKKEVNNEILNIAGLLIVIFGGILFAFVKTSVKNSSNILKNYEEPINKKISTKRRLFVILLSLLAGICYGTTITPILSLKKELTEDIKKYAFSHYTGIFLTSSVYFLIYIFITKKNPFYNKRLIFPAIFGGFLWALAQTCWFESTLLIDGTIIYPINTMLPGVVGSLWSVFYFKEIEGKKNLIFLCFAIGITVLGVVIISFSDLWCM